MRISKLHPVIVVTGPRQSGKTTLCKNVFSGYDCVNLELVSVREQIATLPEEFLKQHAKGIILDEVQRYPELFSYIQVVADEIPNCHFVLTGSCNFALMEKVTQ